MKLNVLFAFLLFFAFSNVGVAGPGGKANHKFTNNTQHTQYVSTYVNGVKKTWTIRPGVSTYIYYTAYDASCGQFINYYLTGSWTFYVSDDCGEYHGSMTRTAFTGDCGTQFENNNLSDWVNR